MQFGSVAPPPLLVSGAVPPVGPSGEMVVLLGVAVLGLASYWLTGAGGELTAGPGKEIISGGVSNVDTEDVGGASRLAARTGTDDMAGRD